MKKIIFIVSLMLWSNAQAQQFSSKEICDKLSALKTGQVLLFFDAIDGNNHQKLSYYFEVNGNTKLGQFFDNATLSDGYGAGSTSQNDIPYEFQQYTFGRLITHILEIPSDDQSESSDEEIEIKDDGTVVKKSGETKTPQYWNVYQLCQQASCTGVDGKKVVNGEWFMTTGIDDAPIVSKDVFGFIFPSGNLPKVSCK